MIVVIRELMLCCSGMGSGIRDDYGIQYPCNLELE
jgi:hypothetical protein